MTMPNETSFREAPPMIQFVAVHKFFGGLAALTDINAEVKKGEVVVVCGPSGSVLFEGKDVQGKVRGSALNQLRSRIGFVFQSFNLFPHLSALDNIMLSPMKVNGVKRIEAREKALWLLDRVGLSAKAQNYPAQLSGGQQQRVAIARALAMEPPAMLFDEPTSALDPEMVGEVLSVMRGLARDGMTMMCVTHEMNFARDVADRIWFMDAGRVLETGAPSEFFRAPQHPRAQRFLSDLRMR